MLQGARSAPGPAAESIDTKDHQKVEELHRATPELGLKNAPYRTKLTGAIRQELRAIAHAEQKNHRVDSELLARMLQAGLIPKAYPKPSSQRDLVSWQEG